VNNLLDTLDTNVGDAVEEKEEFYDNVATGVGGEASVDDILAKRGLLDNDEDITEDEEPDKNVSDLDEETEQLEADPQSVGLDDVELSDTESGPQKLVALDSNNQSAPSVEDNNQDIITSQEIVSSLHKQSTERGIKEGEGEDEDSTSNPKEMVDDLIEAEELPQSTGKVEPNNAELNDKEHHGQNSKKLDQKCVTQHDEAILTELKEVLSKQKKLTKKASTEADAANKESRKLRRNVVKLNGDLDAMERELEAQRTELERAAVRMEKDRQRYKVEKERMEREHKEEMNRASEAQKESTQAMSASHAEQISDMEARIKRAETARAKEGGDMSMELADAATRERETLKKVLCLDDEKATLTSQVSSLKSQIGALHSRTESVQQTAESSSEREREADDRLDAALSLHARQMSQRQSREAELERTIADLGATLVVVRQKEMQQLKNSEKVINNNSDDTGILDLKEKLATVEDEVEMLRAQLMLERQRSETLQNELEDMSQERTQESSVSLARQKQYDRRVADLTLKVSQLQSSLRHLEQEESYIGDGQSSDDNANSRLRIKEKELQKQISTLSEEIMKQRNKLDTSSSEVLTMRNRLRTALTRAENAEQMVISPHNEETSDIERGSTPYYNRKMRRRGGRTGTTSIRSFIKLDSSRGKTRDKVGNFVDLVDKWAIDTGSFFKNNPLARALFLLYLMVLHLWAFCLVLFHFHWSLEPPGNVGPAELLKHSYRHMEQVHGSGPHGSIP